MTDTAEVEVSPFLGGAGSRDWRGPVVHAPDFEAHRERLRALYRSKGDDTPGGFVIRWYGQECLGPDAWDDVVWLAEFFAQALDAFERDGRASFCFPDQPLEVRLEQSHAPGRLRLLIGGKTALECEAQTFIGAMRGAIERIRSFLASL